MYVPKIALHGFVCDAENHIEKCLEITCLENLIFSFTQKTFSNQSSNSFDWGVAKVSSMIHMFGGQFLYLLAAPSVYTNCAQNRQNDKEKTYVKQV